MNEQRIIEEINKKVSNTSIKTKPSLPLSAKYRYWYVGITDDARRRKAEHESEGNDTQYWNSWPADNGAVARYVERHFLELGMDGGTGGGTNANLVYIY